MATLTAAEGGELIIVTGSAAGNILLGLAVAGGIVGGGLGAKAED